MNDKTAVTVAHRIENQIIAKGWPVGELLGSEADLLRQYGVSRGVLRETIRLLEHKQVVKMKPGPGGGLIVAAPAASAVAESISNYFTLSSIDHEELVEARQLLAVDSLRLVAERLSERGIGRLRRAARTTAPVDLHQAIADLTKNAALAILLEGLRLAMPVPSWDVAVTDTRREQECSLVEALVNGDLTAAQLIWQQLLADEADERRSAEIEIATPRGPTKKLPEQLAHQIARDLQDARCEVGDVIGSELELLSRYSVSRSVFRQAVRILEYSDVVHMRAGSNGGMTVGAGDPSRVVDGTVTFLDFMQIAPLQLGEARRTVELSALKLTMGRLDNGGWERLTNELALEDSVDRSTVYQHGSDFHILLTELSENRPMIFFTRVLTRLQSMRTIALRRTLDDRHRVGTTIVDAHSRVVEAIQARDEGLARHRLRKHLDAMVANMAAHRIVDDHN